MPWPLSQDYNEAIQSPAANFADPDLKRGEAVTNALGLPMPCSGNFADVYQVRCPDGSRWAVKCFTREVSGLRERYQKISDHLKQAKLPFTVDFTYLDQGVRVAGKWFPALKMQWVEGLTLNQFVSQQLDKPAMLEALAQIWTRMGQYLRAAEVGHCDLQHGNVLLVPGADVRHLALKLIDYDGMWLPALANSTTGEVGHANYQHPLRLPTRAYGLEVDRFPLLLTATALYALKTGGDALWRKYDNADNVLFKKDDLLKPFKSPLFHELNKTNDPTVRTLVNHVLDSLKGRLEATPLLEEVTPQAAVKSPRPSRMVKTAPPPTASFAPVACVVSVAAPVSTAGGWDLENSTPGPLQSARHRGPTITRRKVVGIGIVAALLLLGLAGAGTVWTLNGESPPAAITPKAPDEDLFLLLRIDQPGAEISVDGRKKEVEVSGDDKPVKVRMKPGAHRISVGKVGFRTVTQTVKVSTKGPPVLPVRLIPLDKATLADDFSPLFNGSDLTGWETHPSQPGNWRVVNGILTGSGSSASHLYTERDDFTDFHLLAEGRINDGGNSGLFFRTSFGPVISLGGPPLLPRGYEAEIKEDNRYGGATGSLLSWGFGNSMIAAHRSPTGPGDWFTLEVIAQGNHITVKVNGVSTVNCMDTAQRFSRGRFALQQNDQRTLCEFRRIEIKELTPAPR